MKVISIKTHKITKEDKSLTKILDRYIDVFSEKSILAITSKIVAICEGRMVKSEGIDRDDLVKKEADYYIPRKYNPYGFCLSITNNKLIASAGIDESNGNGYFILWPSDPQKTANSIRSYLVKRFKVKYAGVIITDSHIVPFSWGVIGLCLGYSGFKATRNYIGKPDIFGRDLHVTHQSNIEGLAASADVVMGGASEQTPLAMITDADFVDFQSHNPTQIELDEVKISRDEDVYWPLFKNAPWEKGKIK